MASEELDARMRVSKYVEEHQRSTRTVAALKSAADMGLTAHT